MGLRINTNVAALNAHKNITKTDNSLTSSLEKLSSGLRINKAADDASGMTIADSLKSQSLGLGQAIRNGNDAISIVQTADAALEESINIVNTIKTKSIQSAQDGQTTDSRKAIQADITKLMEELDNIAQSTSFNNQKLLSGNFTNKEFQIGAYAGETIGVSIQSTEASKIGHIMTSELDLGGPGEVNLEVTSSLTGDKYELSAVELLYNNDAENGVGKVADALNALSDKLGITATAKVESTTDSNVTAGTTGDNFAINGTHIGAITVKENDADGALVNEINKKTSEHGVTASINESGQMTLTASDNRAIKVDMDSATKAVMGGTNKMSTFGSIQLTQTGSGEIQISDVNESEGPAISTVNGGITVSGAAATDKDSIAADGSILKDTTLGSGTTIQGEVITSGTSTTTSGGVIGAGSVLTADSVIGSGTVLGGSITVSGTSAGTAKEGSHLAAGSTLATGTTVDGESIFEGDVSSHMSGGTVIVSTDAAGKTITTVSGGSELITDLTLTGDATLGEDSVIGGGSVLTEGSEVFDQLTVTSNSTIDNDMTLLGQSNEVAEGSLLTSGSRLESGLLGVKSGTVDGGMLLKENTTLGDGSFLADGSSIGGDDYSLVSDVEVSSAMLIGSGSVIHSGSTLAAGTVLSSEIEGVDGTVYEKGTTLANDIITGSDETLSGGAMTLAGGSVLKAGSELALNASSTASTAPSTLTDSEVYRLSDVDVTTQEGAQIGMMVADAALKTLDKVRSDLGSTQNQLTSTISNISTTKVNVDAAESTIRDVDFASESSNFTKMQILSQAGTFAMSQANASSQNVMSLLQ
jgi:flagellin